MAKKIFITFFFFISSCGLINSQEWSKEDSIWLKDVLEGKHELQLNEDTKKAIENGRLIIPSWMRNDEEKAIELIKDFDAGNFNNERIYDIDPYSMPPAVYKLYILQMNKLDSFYYSRSLFVANSERRNLRSLLPTGTNNFLSLQITDNYPGRIIGIGFTFDFNRLLALAFSPLYRQKVYNSKHAKAYKLFTNEEHISPMFISERERKQLRQSMINIKPSISTTSASGIKRNGIDD